MDSIKVRETQDHVLSKLVRKIDLDLNINNFKSKYSESKLGFFRWVELLAEVKDTELQKLCGTDAALYLVFLRYSALYFGLISLVNVVFMALYTTGKPTP